MRSLRHDQVIQGPKKLEPKDSHEMEFLADQLLEGRKNLGILGHKSIEQQEARSTGKLES
jgi:hypothetical protein